MRVLTLWRPWSWAILTQGKPVENRTWAPPEAAIGQPLLLHNGQRWDGAGARFIRDVCGRGAPLRWDVKGVGDILRPGRIVGRATLAAAFNFRTGEVLGKADPEAWRRNPWAFGPWCWVLEDRVMVDGPILTGRQGIWTYDGPLEGVVACP